ncbi:MAG: nitroreductase family protein [Streptococcaceae bacterium]|jgi:nitroreductase|nr:nitroreductase family protein [Streptococcaceae bacterium]
MEFNELNESRHAVRNFDGKKISIEEVKQILQEATLAPSGHNIQSWHFVLVDNDTVKKALFKEVHPNNHEQINQAGATLVLFGDTKLSERSDEILNAPDNQMNEEIKDYLKARVPGMFAKMSQEDLNEYISINSGLVTMNLLLAIKNHGYESNVILGFTRTEAINEILNIDLRFKPELIIPFGTSDEKGYPSYRFPLDKIFEVR